MTDIFEMANFRPVVRLNVGDHVRAIGFPKKEAKSGLVRVKATTVGHKNADGKESTGFVTVEGNQNSVYLQTCDEIVFPEDVEEEVEEQVEEVQVTKEEEAGVAAAKAEDEKEDSADNAAAAGEGAREQSEAQEEL
jgi:hypothetical protein